MDNIMFGSAENNSLLHCNESHVETYKGIWCFLQTAVIVIITVLIILTNLMDILVIRIYFENFTVPESFLISLACADLGVGVLVTPFSIKSSLHHRWMYSETVCGVVGVLVATFCAVSIYSLVLISLDRYIAIIHPLRYVTLMTKKKGYCLIALTWLLCTSIFVTYKLTSNQFYFDKKSSVCGINFPDQGKFTVFIVTTIVAPAVLILCYVYGKIFMAAKRQRCQINELRAHVSSRENSGRLAWISKSLQKVNLNAKIVRDWHKVRMYVCVLGSFLIAWIPYSLLQIILCSTLMNVPQPIVFIVQWTAMANSFWNSIIYFMMYRKYRQGCLRAWKYIQTKNLCFAWK